MKFNRQKVVDILCELDPPTLRRLKTFLKSPYHVKSKDSIIYLKIINGITSNKFQAIAVGDEEKLWYAFLYPEQSFVAGKLEKKLTQLLVVLLEFLGLEEVKKGNAITMGALKVLRSKRLNKVYVQTLKKARKNFSNNQSDIYDSHLKKFELDLEECRFINQDPAVTDQNSFDEVYKSMDDLYLNNYIFLGIRNLTYNNFITPKEIQSRFEKLVYMMDQQQQVEKSSKQFFEEKIFQILSDASMLDRKKIEALAQQLEAIKGDLNMETYKNYRTLIRSFTVTQYNSGDLSLRPVLFQLYKSEVENKSIFFEGKIPSAVVNNIFIFGLRENETAWLHKFLVTIEDKILEPNLQDFTIALNRGKLFFAEGKYDEVLDVLIYEVKSVYFKVYARTLELMTYYELDVEQLHYKIDAYKIFIYRLPKAKVGKDFIAGHHNFIRILRSICHTNTIHDLNKIVRLKSKVKGTKILAEKEWLLGKVGELEEKNR